MDTKSPRPNRSGAFPFAVGLLAMALGDHGVGDLDEAGHVRAEEVVTLLAIALGGGVGVVVDGVHDAFEAGIDFLGRPREAGGVLAHFQAAGGDTAGVGGLAGGVEDAGVLEGLDGLDGAGHVGALGHQAAAVGHEGLGGLFVQLVLGGAGEGAVALLAPGLRVGHVLGGRILRGVLADATALDVLELHDVGELLLVDAIGVVDVAVGVGEGDDLGAELLKLLHRELSDVAGTGDHAGLAREGVAGGLEHRVSEVDEAVAGGLGANQGAAPGEALAGEDAGELVGQALVLPEHVADFAGARADVTGGDVRVGADVTEELAHEALAEAHHFVVALALGVEVATALAAAHGERGQGVLEDLLEAQELEDAQVHGGVQAQAAFVGADGRIELHAIAAVDAVVALVVHPRHAELNHALGLDDTLQDGVLFVLGFRGDHRLQRTEDFGHGLKELFFVGVLGDGLLEHPCDVLIHLSAFRLSFIRKPGRYFITLPPSRKALFAQQGQGDRCKM